METPSDLFRRGFRLSLLPTTVYGGGWLGAAESEGGTITTLLWGQPRKGKDSSLHFIPL